MNPAPLQYGQYYHIYNRGNNRENLFIEERNYRYFLQLYLMYIEPIAWTFAYCLLRNHFHLLVRIKDLPQNPVRWATTSETTTAYAGPPDRVRYPDLTGDSPATLNDNDALSHLSGLVELPNPSRQFSHLFNAYTRTINRTYQRTGALFQRPFGRVPVTTDAYFARLIVYIHQNPQKHGFVDDFRHWKWSSYASHLSDQPTHLERAAVLEWFGGLQGYTEMHAQLMADEHCRWFAEDDA